MLVRLVPIVLSGCTLVSAAVFPSPTGYFNTSTSTLTPSPTGPPCCFLVPDGVGLNVWWTDGVTAIVATVVTQYLQYNNTVIPGNTTTIYDSLAISNVQINSTIFPTDFQAYSRTIAVTRTVIDFGTTTILQPTPYAQIENMFWLPGTNTVEGSTTTCKPDTNNFRFDQNFMQIQTPMVWIPTPTTFWDRETGITGPSELVQAVLKESPTVTKDKPGFETCSVVTGTGQPTVHVRVSALTAQQSTTIRVNGIWISAPAPQNPNDPASSQTQPPVTTPPSSFSQSPQSTGGNQQSNTPISSRSSSPNPPNPPNQPNRPVSSPSSSPNTPSPPNQPNRPVTNPSSSPNPPNPPNQPNRPVSNPSSSPNPPNPPNQPNLPVSNPSPSPSLPNPPNQPTPPIPTITQPPILPIPITPAPSQGGILLPDGSTLAQGSSATISGIFISVPANQPSNQPGAIVIVDGSTLTLPPNTAPPILSSVTIGNSIVLISVIATGGGGIVVPGSTTLIPGAPATTINGHIISIPGGQTSQIVIDGSTIPLISTPTGAVGAPAPTQRPSVLTLGSTVIPISYASASGGGIVLPNGETLRSGSTTVWQGHTISLSPGETEIGSGSTTVTLGSRPSRSASTGARPLEVTGGARRRERRVREMARWAGGVGILMGVLG